MILLPPQWREPLSTTTASAPYCNGCKYWKLTLVKIYKQLKISKYKVDTRVDHPANNLKTDYIFIFLCYHVSFQRSSCISVILLNTHTLTNINEFAARFVFNIGKNSPQNFQEKKHFTYILYKQFFTSKPLMELQREIFRYYETSRGFYKFL